MCAHWRSMAVGEEGEAVAAVRGVFGFAITLLLCRRLALENGRQL